MVIRHSDDGVRLAGGWPLRGVGPLYQPRGVHVGADLRLHTNCDIGGGRLLAVRNEHNPGVLTRHAAASQGDYVSASAQF